jgi:hypothetical protein
MEEDRNISMRTVLGSLKEISDGPEYPPRRHDPRLVLSCDLIDHKHIIEEGVNRTCFNYCDWSHDDERTRRSSNLRLKRRVTWSQSGRLFNDVLLMP